MLACLLVGEDRGYASCWMSLAVAGVGVDRRCVAVLVHILGTSQIGH